MTTRTSSPTTSPDRARRGHATLPRIAAAGLLLLAPLVRASPPEPAPPSEPAAPAAPAPAGFWLSLELIGPRGAQIDAAEALRTAPVVDALPRGGAPPPGELVGRVDSLADALAFVEQHAFERGAVGFPEPDSTETAEPAPLPGGALLREHGVHLTALVLTGASSSGGTQAFAWPSASDLPTPTTWYPASLAVARAPVFAAPSATLPPASERYRVVAIDDAIWQLGALDRCTPEGACLRWAQILVRQGDRWFGGWVPAAQVVADREWIGGPNERRFAIVASHRDRAEVGYALIEQAQDRRLPPRGIQRPHVGASWPDAVAQILGDRLLVLIAGEPALDLELLPTPAPLSPR